MAIEHILALVAFIVIVLALSLLLPTKPRGRYGAAGSSDGGADARWLSDGADCGSADGGGGDGGD